MDRAAQRGNIAGVTIVPLRRIPDERGTIYHMMRASDAHFEQFGEVYFSKVYPGVIKGWHVHKVMTQNYAVPVGAIKLVLYDLRPDSGTTGLLMELCIGEDDYKLVRIPPGVANGYKGIGTLPSLVANCSSHPHMPEGEMDRIDPLGDVIPYRWDLIHR